MALSYYCSPCRMYYREAELAPGKACPECRRPCKPRLILAGQQMGAPQ